MSTKEIDKLIRIPVARAKLEGRLQIPPDSRGLILFAHGSGSSRLSPRNNFVADVLRQHKLATLLIDLLTENEDILRENRFDIDLLTDRLGGVAAWLKSQAETRHLPLGLFGASTGAASALCLAAKMGKGVFAVVSRGGRPDLAGKALPLVCAPTLLIVGGNDDVVIELNQSAYRQLKASKQIVIIPGATHLFEEPGTLEAVASHAAQWFTKQLPTPAA
ncbi:MAG: dienelactone hydrolase family protein [Candidatus Omnitrophica bacterium]|nr:dienelactone hydrolase family protein [Candidatus Omnitrophota bacterium]